RAVLPCETSLEPGRRWAGAWFLEVLLQVGRRSGVKKQRPAARAAIFVSRACISVCEFHPDQVLRFGGARPSRPECHASNIRINNEKNWASLVGTGRTTGPARASWTPPITSTRSHHHSYEPGPPGKNPGRRASRGYPGIGRRHSSPPHRTSLEPGADGHPR